MDWNDAWARDRAGSLSVGPSTRSRLRVTLPLVQRYSKPGDALLDAGCGTGVLLSAVATLGRFKKLAGIDVSELPLERARLACPEAELSVCDLCTTQLADRFDLITCLMTLDLVPDEKSAAKNLSAMLRPGGHLLVVVQHLDEYRTSFDEHYGVRRHDRASLSALLAEHGLELVEHFAWGFPLYNLYYRALESGSANDLTSSRVPSRAMQLASWGLSQVFRLDDLFNWTGRGRVLFAVFRRAAVG